MTNLTLADLKARLKAGDIVHLIHAGNLVTVNGPKLRKLAQAASKRAKPHRIAVTIDTKRGVTVNWGRGAVRLFNCPDSAACARNPYTINFDAGTFTSTAFSKSLITALGEGDRFGHVHVHNGVACATDGHRAHLESTTLSDGAYDEHGNRVHEHDGPICDAMKDLRNVDAWRVAHVDIKAVEKLHRSRPRRHNLAVPLAAPLENWADDVTPAPMSCKGLTYVQAHFLLDALAHVGTDAVRYSNDKEAVIVQKGRTLAIMMPLRPKFEAEQEQEAA